jgi:hypothetical protein
VKYTGPPMTLGNAAAARVRLIVWCKACGARRAVTVSSPISPSRRGDVVPTCRFPEWRERLVCSACGSWNIDMVVSGICDGKRERGGGPGGLSRRSGRFAPFERNIGPPIHDGRSNNDW